ncbi:MAG: serine/threonine protein kinase [Saprospiraceae bacterium]|nr:serine/threonine protein kinase [Saprospiraceae bacterium]
MIGFETGLFIPPGFEPLQHVHVNEVHDIIKAKRLLDNKDVILKISRPSVHDIKHISKLSHEYNILKVIDHPGVVKGLQILSEGNAVCLVEEFCEGESLRSKIFKNIITLRDFFDIAINIADALAYLHLNGIIHKDLNANNILVTSGNKIKIIDFGISISNHTEDQEVLKPDMIEGMMAYISPEQTGRTGYAISPSSDLYSLGIIMYEMISGKPPFDSTDAMEVIHFHLSRKPANLKILFPNLATGVVKLIATCLEKNPEERYQSAVGLSSDLRELSALLKTEQNTENFIPKGNDRSGKFRITQKLYGRENDLNKLNQCLEEIKIQKQC